MPKKPELNTEYFLPNEEEVAQELAEFLRWTISDKLYLSGQTDRDVHAKGIAVVKAELKVEENLPEAYRFGVFAEPKSYPVWVRYSSTFQTPRDDSTPDIRGMALKLMNIPGEKLLPQEKDATTQDFLFLSTNVFLTRTATQFLDFEKAFFKGTLPFLWFGLTNPKVTIGLLKASKRYASLLEIPFFSATPYMLGPRAVKYKLQPHVTGRSQIPQDPGPNYLRENIDRTLKQEEMFFDFMIQFQKDPVKQPIEDALVPWSEEISPFHKVATLRLIRQNIDTAERRIFEQNLSMNPWHCLPEHRPIGNVNRARKIVYFFISQYRHERNCAPQVEPTAGPDFFHEPLVGLTEAGRKEDFRGEPVASDL